MDDEPKRREPPANPRKALLEMVDLIYLCSNNSATGVKRARTAVVRAESLGEPTPDASVQTRRWSRLSKSDRAAIVGRYEAGEPSTVLAVDYGVAKSTVLSILRQNGAVVRRQSLTPEQIAQAQELYDAGHSLSQVAAKLSLKQDTIRLALKAAGVQLRPPTGG
jgi:hypothetical protein